LTGAALLFVSVLFVRNITDIEWDDIAESAPANSCNDCDAFYHTALVTVLL
jgi:xanthine/uracil/vitamin C permease (AzgA family)